MKPIVPFLGVVSALWLFLGTWWMSNMVCSPNNASSFSVNDEKFSVTCEDPFTFEMSSDKMEGTENTTTVFNQIAQYMKDNPKKQLILTGLYGTNEKNSTAHDNLGIARAEKLKYVLTTAGANDNNIKVKAMEVNNLSFNADRKMMGGVNFLFKENGNDSSVEPTDDKPSKSSPPIEKLGRLSFDPKTPTFLNITDLITDITEIDGFKEYLSELNTYLEKYPNKNLLITGYNDDDTLAIEIGRRVRLKFQKMGLSTSAKIVRKEARVSKSPSGMAGVQIEIK
jgi:outer membrane protein OmpA-like peptidoglycan-associated protein